MKILITDDDAAVRESVQTILELNGHEVIPAADGRQALLLAEAGPDFIFCDISMPGMDGFAVLEAVRRTDRGRQTPFVFLTGNLEREDQRRGMSLGADDYVTKPFSAQDILDVITARLHRQRPWIERVNALAEERRRQTGAAWSHELLTPLNGMLGGLQLLELEADTISSAGIKEIIAVIRSGVDRQEKLSRKLIRYFELEQLKEAPPPSPGPPCRVREAVCEAVQLSVAGDARRTDLEVRCDPGEVAVSQAHLVDALAELVNNALVFSEAGTPVRVAGVRMGTDYRIEVTDQGPGMSPEQRRSTAAFVQFGRAKREQQGLGLGLAVVQSVARIAGGRLALCDGPGGKGLTAVLILPAV